MSHVTDHVMGQVTLARLLDAVTCMPTHSCSMTVSMVMVQLVTGVISSEKCPSISIQTISTCDCKHAVANMQLLTYMHVGCTAMYRVLPGPLSHFLPRH